VKRSMELNDLYSGLLRRDRWAVYTSRDLIGVLQDSGVLYRTGGKGGKGGGEGVCGTGCYHSFDVGSGVEVYSQSFELYMKSMPVPVGAISFADT